MKARHFILMFVALLSTVTNVVAQGQQDAFFIYRNDGDFNAFHFHDVDSITYTDVKVVGQDSVFCDHIVAQLIWTQDSVYRIPIEAVDSVGFTALETIINKDVFMLTEEHLPYIMKADTLHFTMLLSTPESLRPQKGNVVVATPECTAFANGIMARVTTITANSNGIQYECEGATLDEIFDQILYYGTVNGDETSIPNNTNAIRRAEANINKELWDKKLEGEWEKGKLKASASVKNNAHLQATIRKTSWKDPIYLKLEFRMNTEAELSFQAEVEKEVSTGRRQIGHTVKIGKISFPNPILSKILWFEPQLTLYGYAEAEGKVGFGFNASYERTDRLAIVYENESLRLVPTHSSDAELNLASLSLEGAVEVGLVPEVMLSVNGSSTGIGITPVFGVREEATFSFDAISLFDTGIYDAIKDTQAETFRTSEVSTFAKLSLLGKNAKGSTTPKRFKTSIRKDYLLPTFQPGSQKDLFTDMKVTLNVERNTLFSPIIGMALYDSDDNIIQTADYTGEHNKANSTFEYTFSNIPKSQQLTAYPIVKIAGVTMRATPAIPLGYCPALLQSVTSNGARYVTNDSYPQEPNRMYIGINAKLNNTEDIEEWGLFRVLADGYIDIIGKFNSINTTPQNATYYLRSSEAAMRKDYNNFVAELDATIGLYAKKRNKKTNELELFYGESAKYTIRYDTPPSVTISNPRVENVKVNKTETVTNDNNEQETHTQYNAKVTFDEDVNGSFWMEKVVHDSSISAWNLSSLNAWHPSDREYSYSYNFNFWSHLMSSYSRWFEIYPRGGGSPIRSNYLNVTCGTNTVTRIWTSSYQEYSTR